MKQILCVVFCALLGSGCQTSGGKVSTSEFSGWSCDALESELANLQAQEIQLAADNGKVTTGNRSVGHSFWGLGAPAKGSGTSASQLAGIRSRIGQVEEALTANGCSPQESSIIDYISEE